MNPPWTIEDRKQLAEALASPLWKHALATLAYAKRPMFPTSIHDTTEAASLRAARYEGRQEMLDALMALSLPMAVEQRPLKPFAHVKPPEE